MLVLTRKSGESIVVGPGTPSHARITVVEIRGDKVRLGIEAPHGVAIHREEIWAKILGAGPGKSIGSGGSESEGVGTT